MKKMRIDFDKMIVSKRCTSSGRVGSIFEIAKILPVAAVIFILVFAAIAIPVSANDEYYPEESPEFNYTDGYYDGYFDIPGFSVANTYTDDELDESLYSPQGSSEPLPEAYDLRDFGLVTSVKNQGNFGTCWAFASINSIESNTIKKGYENVSSVDLSELQLAYFVFNREGVTSDNPLPALSGLKGDDVIKADGLRIGACNAKFAALHLATGIGVTRESDVPYEWASQKLILPPEYAVDKNAYVLSNAYFVSPSKARDDVKKLLMNSGCGIISYNNDAMYYNKVMYKGKISTNYYQDINMTSSHAVSLVGWDDNYPKENFKKTPKNNGAWLLKNSWGTNWGDEGYFWLSYDDPSLSDVVFLDVRKPDSFDNIYQYDGSLGIRYLTWSNEKSDRINTPRTVNSFVAKGNDKITDVSFVTYNRDVSYKVEVLKNDKEVVSTQYGTLEHCGYHTVHLSEPVDVNKGERFDIAVSFTADSNTLNMFGRNGLSVPIDKSSHYSWVDMVSTSLPGQGYFYYNSGSKTDVHEKYNANLRIKAFGVNAHSYNHPNISGDWIGVESLSEITNDGNYYLTKDISLDEMWIVPEGKKVNLCLNGHVIKQNVTQNAKMRLIAISEPNTELNIHDCDSTTKHYFTENSNGLWCLCDEKSYDHIVTGGVITGGSAGGVIIVDKCVLNMFEGNIVGNSAKNGAGMYVGSKAEFNMFGGNIVGNSGEMGAGVYVDEDSSFLMTSSATVNANNEVYLVLNKSIGIIGYEFTGSVGNITGPQTKTDGNTVVKIDKDSSLTASGILNKFALQDKTKKLVASSDGKELLVASGTPHPKISAAGLSLSSDIAVRFYVNDADLEGYYGEYIEVTFNQSKYILKSAQDPSKPRKMFVFKHISPAEMGMPITAKLYATKDGETDAIECGEVTYSVKDYCMNQINKAGVKNNLTTLCVDLLNYGSASQTFCGETDKSKLVSNDLTATQKSWASTTITPAVRNDQSISETGSDSVGAWRAASLNLYSDVSVICKFTTDTNPSDLTATVTYGKNGENTAVITSFTDSTYSGGACKQIKFNNLNAQELNYPIEIVLKDKKTGTVSKTLTYSVDAYSYSKMSEGGDLGNLVTSLMKYIRSVEHFCEK